MLVVEDERDIAFPLVRTLEREGYDGNRFMVLEEKWNYVNSLEQEWLYIQGVKDGVRLLSALQDSSRYSES